jgi:FAD binding domain/Berberine and berberine like
MARAVDEAYSALKGEFRGELLRPRDEGYEQARMIWNGITAKTPGLIARCTDVTDIQAALRAASSACLLTAVRCGGHSLAGYSTCDGGLVIDLSRMRAVTVEPQCRRARFAGGCLLGNVDLATQPYGLAFPAGVVSHTGASGLILGGGFGWLTRYGGLSCDNVEGFTVMTVDGSVVQADERENTDLFWALRGGGGNFGVVTEFRVKLHPVSSVMLAEGFCLEHEIPRMLRSWREFMPEAPERLKWNISLCVGQNTDTVPGELRGRPLLRQAVLWIGNLEKGEAYMEHALSLARPVCLSKRVISFLDLQTMADHEFPHGWRYYSKSGYFKNLDDGSIEHLMKSLATIPSMTEIELAYLGGAAGRIRADATAFGDRSSPFVINVLGKWSDPLEDTANVAWVRNLFEALRPAMAPGVHINFMSGDEEARVFEAYRENWERLVAVKSKYDPKNLLRLNQNIPPRQIARASSLETRN